MTDLRQTQALFWRAITWPTGIDDFLAQADPNTRAAFEATFTATPEFGRRERMTVYAESYFWRLAEVLREQYPVTAWLLGPTPFHNLATDYVLRCPSSNPDIRRFGGPLLELLAEHAVAEQVPGVLDVARIDRAMVVALDDHDGPVATVEELATVPMQAWPGLVFVPSVGLKVCSCSRPYPAMWQANERGDPSPQPPAAPDDPPHQVLVWRHRHRVLHRSVPAAEARALRAMAQGSPFSEICVAAAGPEGDQADAAAVVQWLRRWLERGLIGRVQPTD